MLEKFVAADMEDEYCALPFNHDLDYEVSHVPPLMHPHIMIDALITASGTLGSSLNKGDNPSHSRQIPSFGIHWSVSLLWWNWDCISICWKINKHCNVAYNFSCVTDSNRAKAEISVNLQWALSKKYQIFRHHEYEWDGKEEMIIVEHNLGIKTAQDCPGWIITLNASYMNESCFISIYSYAADCNSAMQTQSIAASQNLSNFNKSDGDPEKLDALEPEEVEEVQEDGTVVKKTFWKVSRPHLNCTWHFNC